MKKIGLFVAMSAVLVSGCADEPKSQDAAASPAPTAAASSPAETPASSPTPSPAPTMSPTPVPEETPQPETFLYRMKANYVIEPIDPSTTDKHVVLLTFDDGPKESETLDPLLAALDKHGAKAIFFVNGFRVEQSPELLTQIHEAGHAIGNHSWDHIMLGNEEQASIDEQITKVQTIVEDITGEAPRFFRPPHASSNDYVKAKAKEEGLLFMTWSNGSLDWDGDNQTADKVIANVMEQLHPGSNILMHELPWTAEALDELLTTLEEAGYGFVDPARLDHAWPES